MTTVGEARPQAAAGAEAAEAAGKMNGQTPPDRLRTGWTTGACATAAAKSAFAALATGAFLDPVELVLPRQVRTCFRLSLRSRTDAEATAGIIKDAGDDPDVTHGALILASVGWLAPGSGILFQAGPGVGTVTRPGLALAVGEPAINPAPRAMIRQALTEVAAALGVEPCVRVTIAIPGGERLARQTLNGRLGILGGLSILGTTGVVVPYSCSAWIHSIHRGIDVARASGLRHLAGATGSVSEAAVQRLYGLDPVSLIEMGDFVGGMLKYLRQHPVERVTLAGGIGKLAKLAQGHLDLHSGRSRVDLDRLADWALDLGADATLASAIRAAPSAAAATLLAEAAHLPLAGHIAGRAQQIAAAALDGSGIAVTVCLFDRDGALRAQA